MHFFGSTLVLCHTRYDLFTEAVTETRIAVTKLRFKLQPVATCITKHYPIELLKFVQQAYLLILLSSNVLLLTAVLEISAIVPLFVNK